MSDELLSNDGNEDSGGAVEYWESVRLCRDCRSLEEADCREESRRSFIASVAGRFVCELDMNSVAGRVK